MDKTKPDDAVSGRPIAKRILAKMRLDWQRKVVNIKNVIAGHAMAEDLQTTVVSRKELESFHPARAAYVYTQNQVVFDIASYPCGVKTSADFRAYTVQVPSSQGGPS